MRFMSTSTEGVGTALALAASLALGACHPQPAPQEPPAAEAPPPRPTEAATLGSIERLDPALDELVVSGARIEVLAEGFKWAEGPVWFDGQLLFSDVPRNRILTWRQGSEATVYLEPSGYTGSTPRGGEPGSNGLAVDKTGHLVLCQHGDRRLVRLDPEGKFVTLATKYHGKRFNSPNDLAIRKNGDIYFTDPPYGLEDKERDPKKEIPYSGVYRRTVGGDVILLTKDLKYPNGIAFSPDEKTLYVSNSDPERAIWMAYKVKPDGGIAKGKVFFDVTAEVKAGKHGLPDGMKVDDKGNLFATGPGGVYVFTPEGKHVGTIATGDQPTSNVAFGDDGSTLYMTVNNLVCRVKILAKGPVGKPGTPAPPTSPPPITTGAAPSTARPSGGMTPAAAKK